MIIILDPGHGINTPGKRSPDGSLLEYKYCREIQNLVCDKLEALGYTVVNTVLTDEDVSLSKRCKIANNFCNTYGNKNCLLVSIHCNAAGFGEKWMNASGWSVYISNNASSNSKKLANHLFDAAQKQNLKMRKPKPDQKYWTQNLAMCRDTKCPAVLTENLFQDNKKDVEFLLSEKGKNAIVNLHVDGIIQYINELQQNKN